MVSKVVTANRVGLDVQLVEVEVDRVPGLTSFNLIGLAGKSIQEAKERVSSALRHSGFERPSQKVVVNLSPSSLYKHGTHYDLPVAIGYLQATHQLRSNDRYLFLGELALDGKLKPVIGVLPILTKALELGISRAILPKENASEAELIKGLDCLYFSDLSEVAAFLSSSTLPQQPQRSARSTKTQSAFTGIDFADIRGQQLAKYALEVAAAGGHHVLFTGPPGCGKTMLCKAFAGLLPALGDSDMLQKLSVYSAAGLLPEVSDYPTPPYRSPHHSSTLAAMIGGGYLAKPGEISLAHGGVLFLDEIAEFPSVVIDSLRQPLVNKSVQVSRATYSVTFPAKFQLLAAMNLCKCGGYGNPNSECTCTASQIRNYQRSISGPIRDRIDIQLMLSPISADQSQTKSESTAELRKRVVKARALQLKRQNCLNANLGQAQITKLLNHLPKASLDQFLDRLSIRSQASINKLAITIADTEQRRGEEEDLLKAYQLRTGGFT